MENYNRPLNCARTEDVFVIASRRALNFHNGDVGEQVFFTPTGGFAPDLKPGFWKPDKITETSYSTGTFRLVHFRDAWNVSSFETIDVLRQDLQRDCPEYDWTVIQYTKVEGFQEV